MKIPQSLHRGLAQTVGLGKGAATPMSMTRRRCPLSGFDQALQLARAILGFSSASRGGLGQSFWTSVTKAPLPEANRWLANLQLFANLLTVQSLEGQQDDPGASDDTLWYSGHGPSVRVAVGEARKRRACALKLPCPQLKGTSHIMKSICETLH